MRRPDHIISHYKDGLSNVEFCQRCGKEGVALFMENCDPIELKCVECGHLRYTNEPCDNCNQIRKMFKKAVDKQNLRN